MGKLKMRQLNRLSAEPNETIIGHNRGHYNGRSRVS
jgi:hypothetical protein